MERKYYISDRIMGVYFSSIKQLKDYYRRATRERGCHTRYHGDITEIKLEKINPHWKQCTI